MSTALIACRALTHVYRATGGGQAAAVADIALDIAAGSFVCLLGPSGCGKTTLLNLIAGFLQPSGGEVRFAGTPIRGPGPERGVVFQGYSLFPWLTAAGNVAFGLRMAGVGRAMRRAQALAGLAQVGLAAMADKYPFELSGGMKQRVAIARALAPHPQVLLMDEPFAALDAMTRTALQADILAIQQRARQTVLFVTHNIGEAIFLADRIVVLSAHPGRIVADLAVDLPRPRLRTDAAFNALHARIERAVGLENGE